MIKGLDRVLNGYNEHVGNYRATIPINSVRTVRYFDTAIGGFDKLNFTYFADNRGFNTRSTNRAVNQIVASLEGKYRRVTVEEFANIAEIGINEIPVNNA